MPNKEVWVMIHADLMQRLNLPCKLRFSTDVKIGQHSFNDVRDTCAITVNSDFDFRQPEHLILHEAAHHRHSEKHTWDEGWCLCWGHCEHWARTLADMYTETGYALPEGTQFAEFAKVAKIIHRKHKETVDAPTDTETVA